MEKKIRPHTIIECPHCHAQYEASEVLFPDNVLGQAKTVIRDPLNKILYVDWREDQEPLVEDEFVCDYCGRSFIVSIETKFKTRPQEEALDFGKEESSLL